MSEPTYTILAVTARYIIATDPQGRRVRVMVRAPHDLAKGQSVTLGQLEAVEQPA